MKKRVFAWLLAMAIALSTAGGNVLPALADTNTTSTSTESGQTGNSDSAYTVTYKDGAGGKVFRDKVLSVNKGGVTPSYGTNPTREGYFFEGWTPSVAKTVTENVTYTAQWKEKVANKEESENADGTVKKRTIPIRRMIISKDAPTRTYEFYVDGKRVDADTQTVKNGEYLMEPSKPEKDGAVFVGWSADDGKTYLSFGAENAITDIPTTKGTKETVRVNAVFESRYTVSFHNSDGSIIKIRRGKAGDVIRTDDITFQVMNGYYVSGWTTDPNGSVDGKVGDRMTLSDKDSSNIDLYPILKDVCWIYFDDGVGNDSTSKSYTAPFYVKQGEKVAKPKDPEREGYTFKGWSLDPNANGNEESLYHFDTSVSSSIVLHAIWEKAASTYSVHVMVEKLVNRKHQDGSYTLAGEYVPTDTPATDEAWTTKKLKATTGAVINPSDPNYSGTRVKLSKDDITKWLDTKSSVSNSWAYDFEKMDQDVSVAGDGSTVVFVYFRLHVFKVNFNILFPNNRLYYWQIADGKANCKYLDGTILKEAVNISYGVNGKRYTMDDDNPANCYSFQARLGEDISKVWPAASDIDMKIEVKDRGALDNAKNKNNEYAILERLQSSDWYGQTYNKGNINYTYPSHSSTMQIYWIDASYQRENHKDSFTFSYEFTTGGIHKIVYNMFEGTDNDYFYAGGKNENNSSATRFYPSAQKGFTPVFTPWDDEFANAPEGSSPEYPNGYPKTDETGETRYYYFYYYRNRYTLEFWNQGTMIKAYASDDKTASDSKIKQGASLKTYYFVPDRPAGLDSKYEFKGWYTTSDCKEGTEFDFNKTKMPIGQLNLYAKWDVPDVHVTYDLNGGTGKIDPKSNSATVKYGNTAEKPDDPTYEGFSFIGWVDADTLKTFNFSTKLFRDKKLIARWSDKKNIELVYDAGKGAEAPKDTNRYMDVSDAVVMGAPKAPAGKYFYGWKYAGNVYRKGDLITVLMKNAQKVDADKYQIILTAVYGEKTPDAVLIYNANGGEGNPSWVTSENNGRLTLKNADDLHFTRDGYTFTGWNTKPDGSGTAYKAGEEVLIDHNDEPNMLYAQWDKNKTYNSDPAPVVNPTDTDDQPSGTPTPSPAVTEKPEPSPSKPENRNQQTKNASVTVTPKPTNSPNSTAVPKNTVPHAKMVRTQRGTTSKATAAPDKNANSRRTVSVATGDEGRAEMRVITLMASAIVLGIFSLASRKKKQNR